MLVKNFNLTRSKFGPEDTKGDQKSSEKQLRLKSKNLRPNKLEKRRKADKFTNLMIVSFMFVLPCLTIILNLSSIIKSRSRMISENSQSTIWNNFYTDKEKLN